MAKYFQYLEQDCSLNLEQALQEYTAGYTFLNGIGDETEESRWFRNHDVTHVIFGTIPFQLHGETINDAWTLAGSDMTLRKYMEFFKYVDYDVAMRGYLKIYKYKFFVYFKMFRLIPAVCRGFWRGWRMKKKWSWYDPLPYMQHTVADIRREFGIKVLPYEKS